MAENVEKILDIKVNYSEAVKAIAAYQTKIDEARDAEKDLKKQLKDGVISRQQYNEEMAASKAAINDYNESIRTISKTMQNQIRQEREQEGSLKSLRAQLSNLTAEYDSLSEVDRNGAAGIKLRKSINDVTDALKEAEEETQRYYRNVGNYKNAIIEAANSNLPFMQQLNTITAAYGSLKTYLAGVNTQMAVVSVTTTGWTKALKLLKIAIIGTGIGALLVALGSLVSWFTKTQKGVEAANKIMGALGATINVIIDRASKLGSALVNVFTGDFAGAAEDAKGILAGIGKEIVEETKQAWRLADALNAIEKREVMLSMSRAANRAEIEKLKKAADDQTLSTNERIKAAEKAAAMEKEDLKLQTELARARIANMLGYTEVTDEVLKKIKDLQTGAITADEAISQIGLSDSTIDDLKQLGELVTNLSELEESSYTRQTEQQNTLNSIRKEGADKAKEAKQVELEAVRAAEDAMLALVKDKREQGRKEIELTYNRQIEDLRIRLQTETNLTIKAKEAINTQILALEKQKDDALSKLSDEELNKELEQRERLISLQLEAVKEGTEQEYQLKMQQLSVQREAELADKELTEEMKLAITEKYASMMDNLAVERERTTTERQQEQVRLRMENELMQLEQSGASEMEILQEQAAQKLGILNSLHQMEGESEEEFLNRKLTANEEYMNAKKAIADKEVSIEQTKTGAMTKLLGTMSNAMAAAGEVSEELGMAGKVLALAEIAVSQGVAIAKAVETATRSSATWIDMLAAISTVVAAVTTVMTSAIKSVKSAKFANGGLVTGPGTGTSDSIPAQLSNGESVMTAKATEMFSPILSSFNMMGGGVPISVAETSGQSLGEDMLASAVAKGVQSIRPVVSVEEIRSVNSRVEVLENLGNL